MIPRKKGAVTLPKFPKKLHVIEKILGHGAEGRGGSWGRPHQDPPLFVKILCLKNCLESGHS